MQPVTPQIARPLDGSLIEQATRAFMTKVYQYMFGGLAMTGLVSLYVSTNEAALGFVLSSYRIAWVGMLVAVWGVSAAIPRLSAPAAGVLFAAYSALMGAYLSPIFVIYDLGSMSRVFFVCSGMYAGLSAYGMLTKRSLDGMRTFLYMGLLGLIVAVGINLFWPVPMLSFITACVGVLVFSGLTAYETQKLREMGAGGAMHAEGNLAISGALALYLNFINLFLSLLRLFASRR
jgi:uncharacterized protein